MLVGPEENEQNNWKKWRKQLRNFWFRSFFSGANWPQLNTSRTRLVYLWPDFKPRAWQMLFTVVRPTYHGSYPWCVVFILLIFNSKFQFQFPISIFNFNFSISISIFNFHSQFLFYFCLFFFYFWLSAICYLLSASTAGHTAHIAQNIAERCQEYFQYLIVMEILSQRFL